ncbi:MAG: metalloendopeptidase-like rane protein [Chloroflexi bacterium]|nr:metalloendopeptidase-like rane protein [Chloroflexota bacterium]
MFRKPFSGEWPISLPFDHDLPFEFDTSGLPFEFDTSGRPKDNNGYLLTWWAERTTGFDGHDGIDWRMPEGTPLLAVADGTVIYARDSDRFRGCSLEWWVQPAREIHIQHTATGGAQYRTHYLHLSELHVGEGQSVTAGDVIGLSGNNGCSAHIPHLHFATLRQVGTTYVRIDPYGWDGPGPDPWAQHSEGAPSQWLWLDGEAPLVYREVRQGPNLGPNDTAAVPITALRWLGWRDAENPNNQFVELALDTRFAGESSFDLSGFTLKNIAGDSFRFPDGFRIVQDRPVRVYGGPGQNTETALYWGRSGRVWNAMGDCAQLLYPDGQRMYYFRALLANCP